MKKLILTLFAVAAVFVACDKDNYEDQFPEIVVPESEEVSSNVSAADFDAAFQFIQNINNSSGILVESDSPSSARGGDYGDNWLQVVFFDRSATDGGNLAYLRSDNQGEVCAGNLVNPEEVFYHLPAADRLVIEIGGTSTPYTVPSGSYDATFRDDGPPVLIVMDDTRTSAAAGIAPPVSDYDFSCAPATPVYEYGTRIIGGAHDGRVIIPADPTDMDAASNPSAAAVGTDNIQLQVVRREAGFGVLVWENVGDPFTNPNYVPTTAAWTAGTGADSNLFSNSDFGSYRVTAAPFPLTGFLATVVSDSTSPANTNNYAGTTEQAVRDAIEANFAE